MINNQYLFNYDGNNNYEIFQQEEIERVEEKCIIEEKPSVNQEQILNEIKQEHIDVKEDIEILDLIVLIVSSEYIKYSVT